MAADQGLDLYANGLIASDETLQKKKSLTLRFLRAYNKAAIWTYRNREVAVDLFLKKYPQYTRGPALQIQDLFFFHFFDGRTEKEGFGKNQKGKINIVLILLKRLLFNSQNMILQKILFL